MQKRGLAIIILLISINLVSAASIGDLITQFIDTLGLENMFLTAVFLISFFVLNMIFKRFEFFKDNIGRPSKTIPAIVAAIVSLFVIYGINKIDFNLEGIVFDLGISTELFTSILGWLIIIGIIYLLYKFGKTLWQHKKWVLAVLGLILVLISMSDLVFEGETLFLIGLGMILLAFISPIFKIFKRKGIPSAPLEVPSHPAITDQDRQRQRDFEQSSQDELVRLRQEMEDLRKERGSIDPNVSRAAQDAQRAVQEAQEESQRNAGVAQSAQTAREEAEKARQEAEAARDKAEAELRELDKWQEDVANMAIESIARLEDENARLNQAAMDESADREALARQIEQNQAEMERIKKESEAKKEEARIKAEQAKKDAEEKIAKAKIDIETANKAMQAAQSEAEKSKQMHEDAQAKLKSAEEAIEREVAKAQEEAQKINEQMNKMAALFKLTEDKLREMEAAKNTAQKNADEWERKLAEQKAKLEKGQISLANYQALKAKYDEANTILTYQDSVLNRNQAGQYLKELMAIKKQNKSLTDEEIAEWTKKLNEIGKKDWGKYEEVKAKKRALPKPKITLAAPISIKAGEKITAKASWSGGIGPYDVVWEIGKAGVKKTMDRQKIKSNSSTQSILATEDMKGKIVVTVMVGDSENNVDLAEKDINIL